MSITSIHGKNAVLYLGIPTAVPLATQTDYEITHKDALVDTTTLPNSVGVVWGNQVKGVKTWDCKFNGMFDLSSVQLWDAALSDSAANFYLYPTATNMANYYYGTGFVTMPTVIKGGIKAALTNSMMLAGNGPLGIQTGI